MKILYIGGNHPRHFYFINHLKKKNTLVGAVMEQRENFVPDPPENIPEIDRINFIRHFKDRDDAELRYFGQQSKPECPVLEVDFHSLNSRKSAEFVKSVDPDAVVVFGAHLLKDPLLSSLPFHTVNFHLGLSPRYRGAATLFWPFYFMEPNFAGCTIHYILPEADAGDIIHQVVPKLSTNDGIHDVACKTVVAATTDMAFLLDKLNDGKEWKAHKQKATGKNFLGKDFRPEHLRVIYNIYDNDMVKHYLDGKIKPENLKLFRQF